MGSISHKASLSHHHCTGDFPAWEFRQPESIATADEESWALPVDMVRLSGESGKSGDESKHSNSLSGQSFFLLAVRDTGPARRW